MSHSTKTRIIAHRGFWQDDSGIIAEPNSRKALVGAFERGWGVETDVRDLDGELVISHDMPRSSDDLVSLAELVEASIVGASPVALNIKSSGLGPRLREEVPEECWKNWYLFDMPVCDLVAFERLGLAYYTRVSDVEHELVGLDSARGVWVDGFYSEFRDMDLLARLLESGKELCMVSPELHKRDGLSETWETWRDFSKWEGWSICTDLPVRAEELFD